MSKRNLIQQKIDALYLELKRLKEQEKVKVGEFMIELYQKDNFDLDKIKLGIAKILGDEITSSGEIKRHSEAIIESEIRV